MKIKGLLLLLAIPVVIFIAAKKPTVENADKDKVLIQAILSGLGQMHYQPQDINDDFSKRVFELYLDRLDGTKLFFLQEDVERLEKYKLEIDDEVSMSSFKFFEEATGILQRRKEEAKSIYEDLLSKPFNFSVDESIELDDEKKQHAKTKEEVTELWRKALKYRVLARIVDKQESQEKDKEEGKKDVEIKSFKTLEKEAREKELKIHNDWFKRLNEQDHRDQISTYLNSITSAFDPHSNYLAPKKKENFDIQMSGRLEGIGAQLREEDDQIKVVRIVPGSASWRQKELEVDDIITSVGQGEEETVDVVGMRLDDAVRLIRGKKGTEVRLTVKKVDGTTKIIPIIRDIVVLDESYAKSTIINYDKIDKKIGFISLPKFYADFTKTGGRYCSSDVAKEVEKLNGENVDGIILDLRNNGGGSLNDVVKMSGLFIEAGPIVQVKSKDGAPKVLKDKDYQTQYDGPFVIMVNSGSASASEIMAAAMQDYNRAVIVGSATTFGKGTVQRFLDLDQAVSSFEDMKPLGAVKLTTQKFYRIDGTTTQLKGVVPDVVLPDRYSYIQTGEKKHDHPMEWDEIEKAEYKKTNHIKNIGSIVQASKLRTSTNKTFTMINENAKELKEERDDPFDSLNFDKFKAEQEERTQRAKRYEDMFEDIPGLELANLTSDNDYIQSDSSRIARFDDWHDGLKSDIYLEETLMIMNDLISQQ